MVYGSDMPVARLVDVVGSKLQTPTQIYYRRPFGVGLLIAGYDKQGPHIYQTCPSANYYRFYLSSRKLYLSSLPYHNLAARQ